MIDYSWGTFLLISCFLWKHLFFTVLSWDCLELTHALEPPILLQSWVCFSSEAWLMSTKTCVVSSCQMSTSISYQLFLPFSCGNRGDFIAKGCCPKLPRNSTPLESGEKRSTDSFCQKTNTSLWRPQTFFCPQLVLLQLCYPFASAQYCYSPSSQLPPSSSLALSPNSAPIGHLWTEQSDSQFRSRQD